MIGYMKRNMTVFRAFLIIEDDEIQLMSRNGKSLLKQFPEALAFYKHYKNQLQQYVPLILDGELTILENPYKSNFFAMQKRGRLRSEQKISDSFVKNPAIYMAFDLLQLNGKNITNKSLFERKKRLKNLLQNLKLPLHPNETNQAFVQYVYYV